MLSTLLLSLAAAAPATDVVAVQAGTIYTVDGGRVIEGGGTVLLSGGKILAVGKTVEIPAGARVVDYGPSAVIAPGLVAADSGYGGRIAADRTAEPGLSALDEFDLWGNYAAGLAGGVTTVYVAPAPGRLIGGTGAVVKLGGAPGEGRVLNGAAALDGSISADARQTPGYWEPPVPATVDVGLGLARPQLPRTTTGAILALRELLALAADPKDSADYGPWVGQELAERLQAHTPWRMRAEEENEIGALLEFFGENNLRLVLTGADAGAGMAEAIAAAGTPVIVYSTVRPNGAPQDRGKGPDDRWPDLGLAGDLAAAGVQVALAPPRYAAVSDLRFHAGLAQAYGLAPDQALSAVTLNAARTLGVAERVGSLAAGKDADLVVLNGPPTASSSSVLATWVDGEVAWKAEESGAVVLEVEQLFVGDGTVLEPGQLLMDGGKIVEVGRRVSHPLGCTVVRGAAAMPGMIDTLGYLGLEGSTKGVKTDFRFEQIIEPGDATDRRVAQSGVTTVLMTPRNPGGAAIPAVAYKPAGVDLQRMIVADPAVVHMVWSNPDRTKSGLQVSSVLQKAAEYKQKWDEYEAAMKAYVPPAEEPEAAAEAKSEEKSDEAASDEGGSDDDKKADEEKSSKKKKKKGEDEDPAFPVTGIWLAAACDGGDEPSRLRFQVLETEGELEGFLRCDAVSDDLVEVSGKRAEKEVTLSGLGTRGTLTLTATEKEGKLHGTLVLGDLSLSFTAEQTSKEYPIAKRGERRREKTEEPKRPKDEPKPPGVDGDLEPFKNAMEGHGAVVIQVDRDDEILACVDACERVGIRPILMGANDAWKVKDELVGRVSGVLLDHRVIYSDAKMGTQRRNRYAELANAGIPVAFHSSAEEGAADLPLIAAYAVSQGMSAEGALYALTLGAAKMFAIDGRVGSLAGGHDADVLLLGTSAYDSLGDVRRVWVNGREVRVHP
ncbi:MAG: amidohydrolase family protein [Planctomycetes bacterium]|nr:amidohydrolase family protein [Planctomycetota bacterium]